MTRLAVADNSVTVLPFRAVLLPPIPVKVMMSPRVIVFGTVTVVIVPENEIAEMVPYCPGVPCSTMWKLSGIAVMV